MGKRSDLKMLPTQKQLHALFRYCSETGCLYWRNPIHRAQKINCGRAGHVDFKGYVAIIIDGKRFLAHRIVWKFQTGDEPVDQIDHKDGNRSNNRFENLRECSNGENIANSKIRIDNKSGVKGVSWDAARSKWVANISKDSVQHRLGRFETIEQAAAAIESRRAEMHGLFARAS